jgi:hypothetical protein
MNRLMTRAALGMLVALLGGCDRLFEPAPARIEVTTDRSAYLFSDTAVVTVANTGRSSASIPQGTAGCFLTAERRAGDGWTAPEAPWQCDLVFVFGTLESGAAIELHVVLDRPMFAASGEYRLRFREMSRSTRSIPSDAFSVIGD